MASSPAVRFDKLPEDAPEIARRLRTLGFGDYREGPGMGRDGWEMMRGGVRVHSYRKTTAVIVPAEALQNVSAVLLSQSGLTARYDGDGYVVLQLQLEYCPRCQVRITR